MTPVEQALAELLTTFLTAFVVSAAITAVVTAPVVWFTRRHLERQEKHSSAKSPHL